MTAKKQTYTEKRLQYAHELKLQVCEILGWTEMDFAEYQFETGIAYLMWYLPCDEVKRKSLMESKLFWNWYKNAWTAYDESWLSFKRSLVEASNTTRWKTYEELHCPRSMAVDVTPNRVVLDSIKKQQPVL